MCTENCTITQFKGKQLSKLSAKVYLDQSIDTKAQSLDTLAKQCKIYLNVQTSFVKHPDPNALKYSLMTDKLNSMHYIGQALNVYIHDEKDKLLCNDICLGSKLNAQF